MNSLNNLSVVMRPAFVQAERLKALPEKDAYNQFVDSALGSSQFVDAGTEQAKELGRIARKLGPSLPNTESRFKLYQACFDSAVDGTLGAMPGGAASLVAKVVLGALPGLDEKTQNQVAADTLSVIQERAKSTPEAVAHADFALQAGLYQSGPTQTVILQNGLGIIADLGTPSAEVCQTISTESASSNTVLSDFQAKLTDLGCKVHKQTDTYVGKLEGQKVLVLLDQNADGQFEQKVGTIRPTNPSLFNSSLFRLSEDGPVENSNSVLGYAVLPSSVKADSPEHVIKQLETQKRLKEYRASENKEFVERQSAQGHDVVAGGKYTGRDMISREVKILYDDGSSDLWEYSGVVVATDSRDASKFKFRGDDESQFDSNRIAQVAFLDGREPWI